MPAVNFDVRWPDGEVIQYYSPSTVVATSLEVGKEYSLLEFLKVTDDSLLEASERVKNKFGYYCSAAAEERSKISSKVDALKSQKVDGAVVVVSIK